MKHPEQLCPEIIALGQLTAGDDWGFYYGTPPDLNFEADELVYPMLFLEKPVRAKTKNTISGTRLLRFEVALMFVYMVEMDDTEPTKFINAKLKAWEAARQFVLRLRAYDSSIITDVDAEDIQDIDHIFDINLAGCLVVLNYTTVDAAPICTP